MKRILHSSLLPFLTVAIGIAGMYKLYFDFEVPFARTGIKNIIGCYVFLGLIIYGVVEIFSTLCIKTEDTRKNIRLLFGSLFFAFVMAEIALRVAHINAVYTEISSAYYASPYMKKDSDTLHIIPLNSPPFLQADEFKYVRPRNNEGFRDSDFFENKNHSKFLIQTYGDSFTEGDGAPMDSSYPTVLRKMLQQHFGEKFLVQNFGVCGSDPAFSYKQFQHIGLKFHPDILVLSYSCFDSTFDFFTRGGLERFGEPLLKTYNAPKWEILYAYSYIFRAAIISLTGLEHRFMFVNAATRELRMKELRPKWNQTLFDLLELAQKNKVRVLLIKKPERSEVIDSIYLFNFSFFENKVDTISGCKRFDLLPYYRDSIHMDKNTTENYYWKKDGHHNSTGYAVMAKGVYCGLQKFYPEIFPILDSTKMKPE